MPRYRLFLTMADGSEKQYDAISYSYHQAGTLLQFETAQHEQMSVLLYYVKHVRVLEIDAAVTTPTPQDIVFGHGHDTD